jgi:hypothetical protein
MTTEPPRNHKRVKRPKCVIVPVEVVEALRQAKRRRQGSILECDLSGPTASPTPTKEETA